MASKFRKKIGIMSEEETKDQISAKLKDKKEEGEDEVEETHSEPDGDECDKEVDEAKDEVDSEDEDEVDEAAKVDGDEDEVDEDEVDESDDSEVDEASKDNADAEFDVNDDSDVFIDDEDEEKKMKEAEEADVDGEEEKVEEKMEADEDGEEEKVEEKAKKVDGEEDEDEEKVDEYKKPSVNVDEDVKALFNGEDFSKSFKDKAKLIMESAVKRKVLEYAKTLKVRYNKKLKAARSVITESVIQNVDSYLDYVVDGWLEENKVAVEHGLRTEITEEFVEDLRKLFESHNIMIPKGKEDLVESQAKNIDSLQKQLNEQVKKNVSLRKTINEQKKVSLFKESCEGLTDTQIEKFKTLAKDLGFDDSYVSKLNTIKESYFSDVKSIKKNDSYIQQNFIEEKQKQPSLVNDPMNNYLNALKRTY